MQFLRRFRLFRNLTSLPTRQSVFFQSTKNAKLTSKTEAEAEIIKESEEYNENVVETLQKRAGNQDIKTTKPQFNPNEKFPSPHIKFVRRGYEKSVGRWLYVCAGGILFLTCLNGYARVAHLGLYNNNWYSVYNTKYPKEVEEWKEEYHNYQREDRNQVSLERFKKIYRIQFLHKAGWSFLFWAYYAPLFYFRFTRRIRFGYFMKLFGLGLLSSIWAASGWKGLKLGSNSPDTKSEQDNYRAIFHTGAGMFLYGAILRNGLATARPAQTKFINPSNMKAVRSLFRSTKFLTFIFALNMITGVILSNKNGGKVFNTWPLMDGTLKPIVEENQINYIQNELYVSKQIEEWGSGSDIGNVQFYHRMFSYLAFLTTIAIAYKAHNNPVPQLTKYSAYTALGASSYCFANGVYTILNESPVFASYTHHCSSWIYFTAVMLLAHSVRKPQRSYRIYLKQFA